VVHEHGDQGDAPQPIERHSPRRADP
jgi:hypothetical protein